MTFRPRQIGAKLVCSTPLEGHSDLEAQGGELFSDGAGLALAGMDDTVSSSLKSLSGEMAAESPVEHYGRSDSRCGSDGEDGGEPDRDSADWRDTDVQDDL